VQQALKEAAVKPSDLSGIAYTKVTPLYKRNIAYLYPCDSKIDHLTPPDRIYRKGSLTFDSRPNLLNERIIPIIIK
jgi:hypothetical protein